MAHAVYLPLALLTLTQPYPSLCSPLTLPLTLTLLASYPPQATYSVTVDLDANQIVVRTSNKKYFKRIDVEELDRARVPLEEPNLTWSHENNTLIVQYKKPPAVMAKERDAKVARLNAPEVQPGAAEGAAEEQCKQQ